MFFKKKKLKIGKWKFDLDKNSNFKINRNSDVNWLVHLKTSVSAETPEKSGSVRVNGTPVESSDGHARVVGLSSG